MRQPLLPRIRVREISDALRKDEISSVEDPSLLVLVIVVQSEQNGAQQQGK